MPLEFAGLLVRDLRFLSATALRAVLVESKNEGTDGLASNVKASLVKLDVRTRYTPLARTQQAGLGPEWRYGQTD